MSYKSVKEDLKQHDMDERIIVLDESSATVPLAAKALHTDEAHIAKTMSFLVNDQVNLIVMAGDVKIDNHKYKETYHKKCKMVPFHDVEAMTGHEPGGVCPFGVKDGVNVYLDDSLKRFDHVFPAAGSAHTAIEVSIQELEKVSHPKAWVDVTKMM